MARRAAATSATRGQLNPRACKEEFCRPVGRLFAAPDFRFECRQVRNDDVLALQLYESFSLKAAQVARDQFADSPNVRGKFLVAPSQGEFRPTRGLFPPSPRQVKQED